MARHMRIEEQGRLITPEILRALDREYRDLVMSLRALAALLREPDPAEEHSEPILARILDAELNQLSILTGEMTVALRLEYGEAGPPRPIDLARVLSSAVRRCGNRALAEVSDPAPITGRPAIVGQAVASALALGLRTAEGRVVATAAATGRQGTVSFQVPLDRDARSWSRFGPRIALLRRIVAAENGRFTTERAADHIVLRLAFPARPELGFRAGRRSAPTLV